MRRSWGSRLVTLVLGLWLLAVLGEPGLVHVCRAHGSAASGGSPGASSGAMHGAAHGSAHGAVHGAAHGAVAHDAAPAPAHAECTCIGCCVGAPQGATPPEAAILVAVARLLGESPTFAVAAEPAPRLAFDQPYPTGPPRA